MGKLIISALLFSAALLAQGTGPVFPVNTAPSGACGSNTAQLVAPGGTVYTCQNGTWAAVSGSGGTGTVTSASHAGVTVTTSGACPPITGAIPGALVTAATGTTLQTPSAAVVGTGQSLSTSGTGTINANQLNSTAIGGALLTDNGGGNTACLRDTLFPGGYLVCSDGSGNLFISTQGTGATINFNINGTQINFTTAGLSMGSGTTITYPISAPVGSVPCFKASGVIGWASNTSGVIGTTCN